MQCFNHSSVAAVGSCKHCLKGLCHECAADLGHGLACKGQHEPEVERVRAMVTRVTRVQAVNRGNKYLSPLFFVTIGAIFLGYGLIEFNRASTFSIVMGASFLAYGVAIFFVVRRAFK